MMVTAVCIGTPQPVEAKSGKTGYFKRPQSGPVAVLTLGLQGDHIADTDNHGGVDQAVYLFGEPDAQWWENHLGKPCPPGFFGENLRLTDLESARFCLGDIITIGELALQVTSPRIPCITYHTVMGGGTAMKEFFAAARPGAYARVLTPGIIAEGDTAHLTPFAGERIGIVENMRAYQANFADRTFLERALRVPAHHKLHEEARRRLA